ncbi:MAG TPA: polysaccharide biosynthesis/export family protein [Dissulfurispiraceae bacterium]|nr:polysaccharide biosynthesis/export family protein [Dissulfurispiraceae bacterium]
MGTKVSLMLALLLLMVPGMAFCGDYVIGEGDTLKIAVWGNQELSALVKVRPDGKITMPAVGDVAAAGMTPPALGETLNAKMATLVKNPTVTVSVEGVTNNRVYIFGNGIKPGVYNLDRRTTLLQLLCMVDDVRVADLRRSYVLRDGKKIKENLYKLFIQGDVAEDIVIEVNDSLFIPPLQDKNVYVVGSVNSVKPIVWRENMTVMEAILEAGGFSKFARENSTVIMRTENGKETTLNVRLKDLVRNGDLSQNLKLQPGDYVVVREGLF